MNSVINRDPVVTGFSPDARDARDSHAITEMPETPTVMCLPRLSSELCLPQAKIFAAVSFSLPLTLAS